ncbi:thioester domain-containing protein [Saccharomonospora sp. NPDC046836]|uniref:thioester domain-containing protein n=1 Tax=Saccharomonospora sp. NPDC046836 TaxID=3156921 RepID=UPI0033D48C0F
MHSRTAFARAGAVLLGASAAVVLTALPATADEVVARIDSQGASAGLRVNLGEGYESMQTNLFRLELDGGNSLRAYCVEIDVRVDPKRDLSEKPWDEFPNPDSPFHDNRDQIHWVLQNGYPSADTDALEGTLTEAGVELHNGLGKAEAIAATQAAVWHFSDGKDLDRENPAPGQAESAGDVLGLYDYLTGDDNVGIGEQPKPTLDISPDDIAGEAGERLGPFTVATTGAITELTSELPEGVTLTDADGTELAVEDITNGTELYVDVPADAEAGEGRFELTGSGHVDTGRLFVTKGYDAKPAQSLIVAQSEKTTLSTGAGVSWQAAPVETTTPAPPTTSTPTEAPPTSAPTSEVVVPTPTETSVSPQANSGDLAETGVSITTPIIIGAVLVAAGVGALLLQRRRANS